MSQIENAITIDVEDWFHILDAEGAPRRERWHELESRLERNTDHLLQVLSDHGARATMFWLGWAAERFPALVRRCHQQGHEIASHGHEHILAYEAGRTAFAEDARRSRQLLEDLTGDRVLGFRVPGFSFTEQTPWAYEVLAEQGYVYSSSVFPAARGHGGMVGANPARNTVHTPAGSVIEFPITTVGVSRFRVCIFGGGYLRITPWPVLLGVSRLHNLRGNPVIYYLHPREVDPEQPRMKQIPSLRYFKYYVNLRSTEPKLRRLLSSLRFEPLRTWI